MSSRYGSRAAVHQQAVNEIMEARMSKHTPGPWKVGYVPTKKREVYIASESGENVVGAGALDEKDARLIAAAPELLALLIESQQSIGGDWRSRRDAAIAKATGEAA